MNAIIKRIPEDEEPLYAALPETVRKEFNDILDHLDAIMKAKSLLAGCTMAAHQIGLKPRLLYERVRAYLSTGSWKKLVNRAKAGPVFWESEERVGLPAAFKPWYQGLCEGNQRVNRDGRRELLKIWRTHHDSEGNHVPRIPGYASWPKAQPPFDYPAGWSERNLARFVPDEFDAAATRIGLFSASRFRPPVLKTRATLALYERVEFDDHEWNLKVFFPGQPKAMRPRGFAAVDALTAMIKPSFKPTLWDQEAEMKRTLTERDCLWFLIFWLTRMGYRTDERGTTLVVEMGLTTAPDVFVDRVERLTHGRVKFAFPGMFRDPAHRGQFNPRGKGNFKHKPLVEGAFSLIDNYFARLPAQVGLDRNHAPEEMHGREAYLRGLLKYAETAAVEQVQQLRLPVLTWAQFLHRGVELFDAINTNSEHALEGWTELGFHTIDWRLDAAQPWQSQQKLLALPEDKRAAVEALVYDDAALELRRPRNLSRQEAHDALLARERAAGNITTLSPWTWADLMGLEHAHEVTVQKNGLFTIQHRDFGTRPIHFLAAPNGRHLRPGEKYLAFVNPWTPHLMLLCKANGAAVGLCEAWEVAGQNDEDAVLRQVGKQRQWLAQREEAMNNRHQFEALALTDLKAHNDAVQAGEAVTEEAQAERDQQQQFDDETDAALHSAVQV